MEPLASPLHVPVLPSPLVSRCVDFVHAAALALYLAAFPSGVSATVLAGGVCLSWFIEYRNRRSLRRTVSAVLLGSDDGWSVVSPAGEIRSARLLPGTFVTAWLVVLRLKPRGQAALHVVLCRDNTLPDPFRRLRVRLQIPLSG